MKLWLKANPDVTAETISDTQIQGFLPVIATDPDGDPVSIYAIIDPSEWSTEEIVPAPESVPDQGFVVLYGEDPARVEYAFFAREKDAAVALSQKGNGFGYIRVFFERNTMIQR